MTHLFWKIESKKDGGAAEEEGVELDGEPATATDPPAGWRDGVPSMAGGCGDGRADVDAIGCGCWIPNMVGG